MKIHEAICRTCLVTVQDMANGQPTVITGWCPHRGEQGMGYMLSLRPDRDPMLLQAASMTEDDAAAMRDRVMGTLRPRRPGTLNA